MITTNGSQMMIYFNQVGSTGSHKFYFLSGSAGNFMPRITFYPGNMSNRKVRASWEDKWADMGGDIYSDLKKLIIAGGTMNAGAQFILWGEE